MKEKVSVPFMLLGILFNVCLIAANLLETKVIQIGSLTVTAGLFGFFLFLISSMIVSPKSGDSRKRALSFGAVLR